MVKWLEKNILDSEIWMLNRSCDFWILDQDSKFEIRILSPTLTYLVKQTGLNKRVWWADVFVYYMKKGIYYIKNVSRGGKNSKISKWGCSFIMLLRVDVFTITLSNFDISPLLKTIEYVWYLCSNWSFRMDI